MPLPSSDGGPVPVLSNTLGAAGSRKLFSGQRVLLPVALSGNLGPPSDLLLAAIQISAIDQNAGPERAVRARHQDQAAC